MAVVVYFPPSDVTVPVYDAILKDLTDAGYYPAPGMLMHACFTDGDKVSICDLWESAASFQAFGENLQPILAKHGANPGEPMISECHNYLVPEPART